MVRRAVEPLQRHQRLISKPNRKILFRNVPDGKQVNQHSTKSDTFTSHRRSSNIRKILQLFHLRVFRGFPAGISQLDFASDAETRFIISFSSPSLPVHLSPTYT